MSDRPVILRPDLDPSLRKLSLEGPEQHHLCRVLRLRAGDAFELRDGKGLVMGGRLLSVERRRAEAELEGPVYPTPPAGPRVRLALPLLKGRRLDWALEKGTELGVGGFHLYQAKNAVVKREKSPDRYGEVLRSAYCQSWRLILPELDGPAPFAELLARAEEAGWVQGWGDETRGGQGQSSLSEIAAAESTLVWIGPEGGFSEEEREALEMACVFRLDLGPQRLRAETAAVAAACRLLLPPEG